MLVVSLYVYAFLSEFILIYPVYALLFTDTGVSVAEVSSLFVIWAVTGMVLEIPSGAWADTVSRRLLLFLGPLLSGLGFALWVMFPSYWVFAAGFVLWGAEGALVSGAYEALAYEEMERRGRAGRYAAVMGRATALGLAGSAAAIGLAAPVFAVGGYPAVGAASVLACVLCAATALTLPEHRTPAAAGGQGYLATLREGLALARADRKVLRAVLLVAFVTAIWGALEEYVPFLGEESGVAKAAIPLLILLVWVGATAGGLLAGPAERRLRGRAYGALLGLAALAMAAGALSGHPAGFVAIAVAVGAFQLAQVLADVRLQERISGPARATVTSVAGLGTNVVTLGVYAVYGTASSSLSHGTTFALVALTYLIIALGFSIA
ncbi:putative transport protein [[Actinomadura] parvosata subsp. kistnae]|uniref:MFS transporter n=1 Tax=[Actinomadura] parvosata subsp. kistnae TaxID=1909395 RepID=A0A1V0ABK0_9ACTN|nr:MFS transporter [Nonomuraea sp. ATCC 55076]AQZ67549.1 MFS transporter [Nonomuraea sp. ATCC 55076]SPL94177.1 putative transport protein [Actinomadura parvosata subsp. kistnae]